MDHVRWGIIGCGDVTEVKSGPAFSKVPHSSLVAVMRRNGEKAREYAERHQIPRWYDDAEKLIRDPEVDAVYVATPPSSHAQYTIQAAHAGKPVLVEKPMARRHEECVRMISACERAGVPLFVAYYRRRLPSFLRVKHLVESRTVGEVRAVSVRLIQPAYPGDHQQDALPWRVVPAESGGGYFFDLASHQFDFLDYLFGPVRELHGYAANQAHLYPAEDIVVGHFAFESGVCGEGLWCFTSSETDRTDRIEIIGTGGTISFSTFGRSPVRLVTSDGPEDFHDSYPEHVHQPLVQSVVDALRGGEPCPSTGTSGARTSWVLEEMTRNYHHDSAEQTMIPR